MYEPNEALKHFTLMIVDRYQNFIVRIFALLNGTRSLLDYSNPFSYTLLVTTDPTSVPPWKSCNPSQNPPPPFPPPLPNPTLAISNE